MFISPSSIKKSIKSDISQDCPPFTPGKGYAGDVLGSDPSGNAKVLLYRGRWYFFLNNECKGSTDDSRVAGAWANKFGVELDEGEIGEHLNGLKEMYSSTKITSSVTFNSGITVDNASGTYSDGTWEVVGSNPEGDEWESWSDYLMDLEYHHPEDCKALEEKAKSMGVEDFDDSGWVPMLEPNASPWLGLAYVGLSASLGSVLIKFTGGVPSEEECDAICQRLDDLDEGKDDDIYSSYTIGASESDFQTGGSVPDDLRIKVYKHEITPDELKAELIKRGMDEVHAESIATDADWYLNQSDSSKKRKWKHPDEVAKDNGADITCSKDLKSSKNKPKDIISFLKGSGWTQVPDDPITWQSPSGSSFITVGDDGVPGYSSSDDEASHLLWDFLNQSKTVIQSDLKRDIQKMIEYKQKGSNPEALARSVRDVEKAKNRYAIAKAMGWSAAEDAFYSRLRDLGLDGSEIDTIEPVDLSGVSEQVSKASSVGAQGKYSLPAPLDRYLRSLGLSYEMESMKPTPQAYYKDLGNGRRWTLMYKITASNGTVFYFVNHSDEGGGSYGYSLAAEPNYSSLGEDLSIAECLENLKYIIPENQAIASAKNPQRPEFGGVSAWYSQIGDAEPCYVGPFSTRWEADSFYNMNVFPNLSKVGKTPSKNPVIFWKPTENDRVFTPDEFLNKYLSSVSTNSSWYLSRQVLKSARVTSDFYGKPYGSTVRIETSKGTYQLESWKGEEYALVCPDGTFYGTVSYDPKSWVDIEHYLTGSGVVPNDPSWFNRLKELADSKSAGEKIFRGV